MAASSLAWESLSYEARRGFVTGEADLTISPVDIADKRDVLWPAPGEQALQPCAGVMRLNADVRLPGNKAKLKLWLDPLDYHLYQRWRLTAGSQSRLKTSRFLARGALWMRRNSSGSSSSDPESWDVTKQKIVPYPPAVEQAAWLDPLGLLLLVSSIGPSEVGEQLVVPVFTDQQAYQVTLRAVAWEALDAKYQVKGLAGWQNVEQNRDVLKITVSYLPLQGFRREPEFNLLGLTGDIYIYVDPVSGLPVQLEGDAEPRGRLAIKLYRAVLPDTHSWDVWLSQQQLNTCNSALDVGGW